MSTIKEIAGIYKGAYSSEGKRGDKIIDTLIVTTVDPNTNQVHETPCDCIIKTLITPHREARTKSRSLGLILSNLSRKRLSKIPYVKDAILSPVISSKLLLSSKTDAIKISANAQKTLTNLDRLILSLTSRTSLSVEEDNELMDELSVDIAAERKTTSRMPLTPFGR